jgi:hypothetical protein
MNAADKEERARVHNAIRARISLIATERGLPKSETSKVLSRLKHYDVMRFAEKHRVNLDWLIAGDLKGLLETAKGCPSRPREPALTPDELRPSELILRAIEVADRKELEFLLAYCRQIVKNGGDAA